MRNAQDLARRSRPYIGCTKLGKGILTIFYVQRVLRQDEIGPDKKRKLTFETLPKGGIFFTKSVVILLKNRQNMLKLFLFSRHEPASNSFFLFPSTSPKNPYRDPSKIE